MEFGLYKVKGGSHTQPVVEQPCDVICIRTHTQGGY